MSGREEERAALPGLAEVLAANPYPGRGILCARTADGAVVGGYFVTGRSEASREREIRATDAGELAVAARGDVGFDPLRHYIAATALGEWLVFGNGAQVSAVAERLARGEPPQVALDGLEHEPDEPIYTDRITAVIGRPDGQLAVLGAARRSMAARQSSDVITMCLHDVQPGEAVLLTTYRSDGRVIEGGQPFIEARIAAENACELLDEIWSCLEPAYRVAAVVIPAEGGVGSAFIRNAADVH